MRGTRDKNTVEPNRALVEASLGSTQEGQAKTSLDHVRTVNAVNGSARGMKRFTGTP
jgi:hypothetical protein